jgi:adenosine deaminase
MDLKTFLRKIPKVELHCHLAGTVNASTFVELANKNGIPVPQHDQPNDIYTWTYLDEFLKVYRLVSQSVQSQDDFRRTIYEVLQVAAGDDVRYHEMFWSPTDHLEYSVSFETQLDGLIDGIKDAEKDFGIQCRLIAALDREKGPDLAVELVELMIAHRRDELIGLGADYNTTFHPTEAFWKAFRLAGEAGFHRTAHAGEFGHPARDVETCLDLLECERIDHGYRVLEDERLTQRCRDEGVIFTVIPMADRAWIIENYGEYDLSKHVICDMVAKGLRVVINSDDPAMMKTYIGDAYIIAGEQMGFAPADFKQFVINGIDAAWVDESTKRQWRQEWSQEIDELISQLGEPE